MRSFSLSLIAVGAILAFAVSFWIQGIDLRAVGVILMVVGGVGLVFGVLQAGNDRGEHEVTGRATGVYDDRRTVGF
jgi:hypothetical protein